MRLMNENHMDSIELVANNKIAEKTRTTHADERRCSLVLAAYQIIAKKGFEELWTRDVAAQAGVNIATLHYYIASKEGLIQGVVDHVFLVLNYTTSCDSRLNRASPREQLRAKFLNMNYYLREIPEVFIVLAELVLRSLRYPSMQPTLRKLDDQWHGYLKRMITDGVEQGQFRTGLDSEGAASKIIVMLKGVVFHQITYGRSVDVEGMLKDIERLLLRET